MEAAFPGSSQTQQRFDLSLVELSPGETWTGAAGLEVLPAVVRHGEPENASHAYRVTANGRVVAYTGDTAWTDSLIAIGRGADLMIAEAYVYDKRVPLHLDYVTLREKLPLIAPRRVLLTHMSDDMLGRSDTDVTHERAEDGLVLTL
jgi:ribonuclease BN (tRNA processing enzyme)